MPFVQDNENQITNLKTRGGRKKRKKKKIKELNFKKAEKLKTTLITLQFFPPSTEQTETQLNSSTYISTCYANS